MRISNSNSKKKSQEEKLNDRNEALEQLDTMINDAKAYKAVEGLYGPWWIRFPHASASPRPEHCFSTGIFVLI
jgi:hypothetical protein